MNFKQSHTNLSDSDLLNQFVNTSDQHILGELYVRYVPLVYGLCLKYLRHQQDAEDAVMQIYEELSLKIRNYEIKEFKTWLYSVAKNHCLQLLRKNQLAVFEEIGNQVMENESFPHLFEEPVDKEQLKALTYCLGTLSAEQKQCIEQFFYEQFSYADIVSLTGYTLSKVKSYIQNGKRNLKTCMVKALNL